MPLPAAHFRPVQSAVKTANAKVWGVAAVTAQPLAALPPYGCGVPFTGGERHWQLQVPAHSADRTGSRIVIARAFCARGNLGKAVTFSPEVPNYPAKYCEIPTSLRSSE